MASLKAVVFDVYETLVPNGPDLWLDSFREVCRLQSLSTGPQELWDRWIALERRFRHRRLNVETMELREPFESYEEAWSDCFRQVFQDMELSGDPVAATRLCIQDLGRRPAYPDALPTLEGLDGRLKLGVLSNADSSFFYPLLQHHGIGPRFAAALCSSDAQAYKPHPSLFHQLLERLGVAPEEALQVGDTLREDVLGAKLIGMRTAWVNRSGAPGDPALPRPDYEVQSLIELLDIVARDS